MLAFPKPVLPQVTPSRPTTPTGGTTITVGSGKDYEATQAGLQAAMDAASRGDIIEIDAGSTISVGSTPLIMKRKAGSGYVWVRSSNHAAFTDNIRAGSGDTANMAKIQKSGTNSYLLCPEFIEVAGEYAHSWAWEGIEFTGSHTSGTLSILITLMRDSVISWPTDQSWEPRSFHFLHCWIHGDDTHNYRVGVDCARDNGIWDCTINNIHEVGADSQAVGCTNGTGGVIIDNCAISAAGECIMWGGGTQRMSGVNMADFTVRRCDIYWDTAWQGSGWTLKNLLEIKHGQRHLFENCTIHDCWVKGQSGYALVFKENGEGDIWNDVKDTTVRNCKIYDCTGVCQLLTVQKSGGGADAFPGMTDLLFANNVGWNLNREMAAVGGGSLPPHEGALIETSPSNAVTQLLRRCQFRRNTFIHDDFGASTATGYHALRMIGGGDGPELDHFYMQDNIVSLWGAGEAVGNRYGFTATDPTKAQQYNQGAVESAISNYAIAGNLLIGAYTEAYFPSGNTKAANYAAALFENWAGGDLRLAAGSPGRGAGVYGGDCGANIPAVDAATAHCIDGDWT